MAKVKVFQVKVWNSQKDGWVIAPFKSTASRVEDIHRLQIIPGTEEEVDEADLDKDGRYDPGKKWIALMPTEPKGEKRPDRRAEIASRGKDLAPSSDHFRSIHSPVRFPVTVILRLRLA
jgi:hypothetical protein